MLGMLLGLLVGTIQCKSRKVTPGILTYRMGERVTVGNVIYNVLHAEWKPTLGEGANSRTPEHRFLVLRLSMTNSGPKEIGIPLLSIFDPQGKQYRELDDAENVPGWLGLYRILRQVETQQGTIVFDAPPGAYKLQVTDGGEPGSEVIAYVDIPLNLEADPVLSEPPALPKK